MIAFITGATSGIGSATAHKLAAQGYQIIATGRRNDRLEEMEKMWTNKYQLPLIPLCFDVRDRAGVFEAIEGLDKDLTIDVLINNAGGALGRDSFDQADIDDWDTMIDANVKGLLYVTRAVLPRLKKSTRPHIFNIGSTAGKEVYAAGNVYCASKFAVDALSKAMRIDLLEDGVKVTQINPGLVETEFSLVRFKGDKEKANAVYAGYQPLVGEDIAEVISSTLKMPAHVCLNDIVVTATAQANSFYLNKK